MQTKKQSSLEALTNTLVGFVISYASTFIIFPLMGFESSAEKNIVVTLFFTVISYLRNFIIRRVFNNKIPKAKRFKTAEWLHCFECEIEMPVAINPNTNIKYCANCGLNHGAHPNK